MPTKARYHKIVKQQNKCVKCGGLRDDKYFITCSKCRKAKTLQKENDAVREQAMAIFGIRKV